MLRLARKTIDAHPGLTWACWWEPIEICDRCRPEGMCTALRDGEYECLRCNLADGLNNLLRFWSIRPLPGWFAPLRDAILTIPDPRSGLAGVGPAIRALGDLLSGDLPISHEALDGLRPCPCGRLRSLLVASGALPHPDPDLAGLESLFEDRLELVTRAEDGQALAAFGRWRILELARRAEQWELTTPEIENDRARILEAERLLCWLERQGGSVDDLMQTDVDAWFALRSDARSRVCDFLVWALDRGIVSNAAVLIGNRRLILLPAGQRPRFRSLATMTATRKPDGPLVRFLLDPEAALRALVGWLTDALPILLLALGFVAAALAGWRLWTIRRNRRLMEGARRIRVLSPTEIDPVGARTLWMGLHALLRPWWRRLLWGQPYLAWEIVATSEDVEVSVQVPKVVPDGLVQRVIEASWPGARTQKGEGDPLARLGEERAVESTDLALAEPEWFPIGTTPGAEPLTLGLAALAGLADGEAAAIQVLAQPVTSVSRRRFRRAARNLRARAAPSAHLRGRRYRPAPDPSVEGDVRAILAKASSPAYRCQVRLAVASPSRDSARGRIHGLAGAFALFEGRNGFRRRRVRRGTRTMLARRLASSYLLSVPELAQIASLPAAGAVPGLERAGARTVAPPRILSGDGKVLGEADHVGVERPVAIRVADARHHLHVIGETGTGKSTLLANLVLQDAQAGRSAVVIDPKGDLVEAIMARLPDEAARLTCLIDPDDTQRAVGLNVLEGDDRDLVVDHIAGVFKRIYEPWWGPRTDDIMRAACITLTQIPGSTLAEVPLLLTDYDWRRHVQDRLTDVVGIRAFWKWYDRLPEPQRAQHIAPLLNKLRAFVLRGPVRAIVGQAQSRLDIGGLLDSGGLLLVRIPKGTVGEETSRLLGAFVITRVWQACMKRAARAEADRPDTALYVDEMHNYLVLPRSFEDLLAEARGYRLSLVLAHQHMGQLPRDMRDALGANARTKVVFTCSPEDAFILARHFAPELGEQDLSHLATFQAACRPCVGGGQAQSFTFRTKPLTDAVPGRVAAVREQSAARFGAPRSRVEAVIMERQLNPLVRLMPEEQGSQSAEQSGAQSAAQSGAQSWLDPSDGRVTRGQEPS